MRLVDVAYYTACLYACWLLPVPLLEGANMHTYTWDDYMLAAVLCAIVTVIGAIFEWRRQARERELDDARHDRNRQDADIQGAQLAGLGTQLAVLEAVATERENRWRDDLAAAGGALADLQHRVMQLEIEARAAELAAEGEEE